MSDSLGSIEKGDVLPLLHARALQQTHGAYSLLFEYDLRNGRLHPTSSSGRHPPPADPWAPDDEERALVEGIFGHGTPTYVPALQRQMPDLWTRIDYSSALLLPLARGVDRTGLLVVGFEDPPPAVEETGAGADLANAFLTAIELSRLRKNEAVRALVRELLDEFSVNLSATLNIGTGLQFFCQGANGLFSAERTSIWIHDRRAGVLVLQASSDPRYLARAGRVAADDPVAPPAVALRRRRADLTSIDQAGASIVTVPLRGCRRALGTLVAEGIRVEPGGELDLLDRGDELGRQLSNAIESIQLIENIIETRANGASVTTEIAGSAGARGAAGFSGRDAHFRLSQSDKLAALGQFIAGIAHELNNPLQGVLGHLELLRATHAVPKALRREVLTIYREAARAAKIVRNLLVFAGSQQLARRSVNLNALLQKVMTLRQPACRAQHIELARDLNPSLPRFSGDPLLLQQAFLNIVMNAEQAIAGTGQPGRITVRTSVADTGDRIIASVHDSGEGIPEDGLAHLFEPFYTTKDVGQGTGLGLAIAYGIVQEHGGVITAANHPERGAIFTIELPLDSPA